MKSILILLCFLAIASLSLAQNTYPWASSGNVGIGTTSPGAPLTIQAQTNANALRFIGGTINNNSDVLFYASDASTLQSAVSSDAGQMAIGTYSSNPINFFTANNIKMTILANGDVGIGTTAPSEKLSVNGKIRAKEVKVESSSWPDYVFESSYKLPDLLDTERFIKRNGHLPEIPTEKDVAENGINLGEINSKLLQKIEELMLYMIEMKKENDSQQKEINELKSRL